MLTTLPHLKRFCVYSNYCIVAVTQCIPYLTLSCVWIQNKLSKQLFRLFIHLFIHLLSFYRSISLLSEDFQKHLHVNVNSMWYEIFQKVSFCIIDMPPKQRKKYKSNTVCIWKNYTLRKLRRNLKIHNHKVYFIWSSILLATKKTLNDLIQWSGSKVTPISLKAGDLTPFASYSFLLLHNCTRIDTTRQKDEKNSASPFLFYITFNKIMIKIHSE